MGTAHSQKALAELKKLAVAKKEKESHIFAATAKEVTVYAKLRALSEGVHLIQKLRDLKPTNGNYLNFYADRVGSKTSIVSKIFTKKKVQPIRIALTIMPTKVNPETYTSDMFSEKLIMPTVLITHGHDLVFKTKIIGSKKNEDVTDPNYIIESFLRCVKRECGQIKESKNNTKSNILLSQSEIGFYAQNGIDIVAQLKRCDEFTVSLVELNNKQLVKITKRREAKPRKGISGALDTLRKSNIAKGLAPDCVAPRTTISAETKTLYYSKKLGS